MCGVPFFLKCVDIEKCKITNRLRKSRYRAYGRMRKADSLFCIFHGQKIFRKKGLHTWKNPELNFPSSPWFENTCHNLIFRDIRKKLLFVISPCIKSPSKWPPHGLNFLAEISAPSLLIVKCALRSCAVADCLLPLPPGAGANFKRPYLYIGKTATVKQ